MIRNLDQSTLVGVQCLGVLSGQFQRLSKALVELGCYLSQFFVQLSFFPRMQTQLFGRFSIEGNGLIIGIDRLRTVSCPDQVVDRFVMNFSLLIMIGQQFLKFFNPVYIQIFNSISNIFMDLFSAFLKQAVISHFLGEGMLKNIF